MLQPGNRKMFAFILSMAVFLTVMLFVLFVCTPQYISLDSFAVSLATGIMLISAGFYAGNAYENRQKKDS